jgi:hypothetical protein
MNDMIEANITARISAVCSKEGKLIHDLCLKIEAEIKKAENEIDIFGRM